MAQVIVEWSRTKLRSAIATECKFIGDLKEMMAVLDAIQPLLEGAERQSVPGAVAWYWLRRVRKTAYDIFDVVDELQAESTPAAGTVKMQINVIKKELEEIRLESALFKQPRRSFAERGEVRQGSPEGSLESSYRRMPPNLKLCFAYCAVFPKGHNIVKHDLIHQWIALHLVEASDSTTQRAEEYITKLLDISFLQARKSAPTRAKDDEACAVRPLMQTSEKDDKGATLLTMPDKVHDFVISVMGAELIVRDTTIGTSDRNEYSRYALLTDFAVRKLKLSSILPAQLRMLRFVGSSKMQLSHDSFSFARCLRVLELKQSSMQKLPDSICQLRHLGYLNLAGSSELVTLPELFGNLINLFHINLTGCCRLANLPESFGTLKKLVHLDLSFSSCFQGIRGVLGGLTSLQHLNLSHPCCYLTEHRSHLQELRHVFRKLTKLLYLNLSMFLNPIFCYMTEEQRRREYNQYIGSCISGLSSLEHLDLSYNIFLRDLPENLGDLNNLHTLDLSGCIRLFPVLSVIKRTGILNSLKLLAVWKCRGLFVVRTDAGAHNSSNLVQLKDVNCQELEISCLEKVKSTEEARRIRLSEKGKLRKLNIHWTEGCQGAVEDKDLLGELVPPHNLQSLELHGYNGTCFPPWTLSISSHLPNLVEVTMEDIPRCSCLPQLGLLPNLQQLVLRRMASIERIDAADLSGGNTTAFHRLSKFTIDDMKSLEESNISYIGDESMLSTIDELVIRKCPKLSFGPLPPRARRLLISACDQVMSSWRKRDGTNGVEELVPSAPVTELVVENCKVPLDDWSLLCHLPDLQTLRFSHCHSITSLPQDLGDLRSLQELNIVCCKKLKIFPDSMRRLTSLQSMYFEDCESIEAPPEWFGRLTSLQILSFSRCHAIQFLPSSMKRIRDLRISDCPQLEKWCEEEDEKERLADIIL